MSQPAIFLGHGSPMNAIERNAHTEAWAAAGRKYGKPRVILAISAHWYVRGTAVTAMRAPPTIHDFGGFPPALHAFDYPAPGDPALAARVMSMLAPLDVRMDQEWGLDHGTWAVLCHVYPEADVPIVQLAIDGTQPPRFHYELGQRIAALRDEGVMLVGSGNVVHNLRAMRRMDGAGAYPWALQFNGAVRDFLSRNEHAPLVDYHLLGEPAALSVPTPEHYLPMLYVAGARRADDEMSVMTDGIELASISMLSFALEARR
jgi:4,5-DOPA dioxygenase extradiol